MVTIFVIGIIVALLVEETTGLTPGGLIVPGFLALYAAEPARIAATLITAIVVWAVVLQIQKHMFLYGRRRFGYCVLTGIALKSGAMYVLPWIRTMPYGLLVIGLVIPGLIAETFIRQGIVKTMAAMVLAVGLTRLASVAVMGWMP